MNRVEFNEAGKVPKEAWVTCNSKEEALGLIREFWENVAPSPHDLENRNFGDVVTIGGDRTKLCDELKDDDGNPTGQFQVFFSGNGKPFGPKAYEWLRGKGIIG